MIAPLLFFTSNARALYRRDMLNLCTEPEGAFIRFGYDRKWIAENARSKLVVGTKVLVIYSELVKERVENKEVSFLRFLPIRLAEIVAVESVREAVTADLKLEKFFEPWKEDAESEQKFNIFQKYIASIENYPNLENVNRKFVLRSDFPFDSKYFIQNGDEKIYLNFTSDCLPLLEIVKEADGLNDCHFIFGRESISKNSRSGVNTNQNHEEFLRPHFCLPNPKFEGENVSYSLKAGQNYNVKLLVVSGKKADVNQIPNLTIEETISTVSVLGPFVKQNPFGFETHFIIRCKHSLHEEWGGLFVRIKPDENKDNENKDNDEIYKSTEIFGVINVARDNWFIAIYFLIPLSIFCTFIGTDFIRDISDNRLNKFLCEWVMCISPFAFSSILKIIGVAFSLGASYLLTQKVSFK